MHRTLGDGRDDPDPWSHESAEVRDLTRHVKPDLDHGNLVTSFDAEEGHRHTDLIVEGGRAAQHAVTGAQRRGGRFLRGRLADVSRDPDGRDGMRVAERLREPSKRVLRVRDLDHEGGVRQTVDGPLHDRRARPTRERVRHELMAIATIAEREEHAPWRGDARIERAPTEAVRQVRDAVDHPSTRRAEHLLEGEHALPNGTFAGLCPPAPGRHGLSGCTRA